jgi:DNA gyrase subunit B
LHATYYRKTIAALKRFEGQPGDIDLEAYRAYRIATRDKSLLRFDTFCRRYFGGDVQKACEAVARHNHRVVNVERLQERTDVYDLEVPGTHNFALASGVFVHNSAKQGRDNRTQAVLPLRGKILNSEGLATGKALANQELADLVSAIGTGAGEKFNLAGLRYGKIILLMDADADGHHISTLLLTFFFRHMPELIRKGHVYIAQPPLYRIDVGKETQWARDDAHKEEILASLRANAKSEITRFKGLGEMPPQTLKATTMDPRQRTLLRVNIESNLEADQTFVELLGKDAASRYRFIMDSAALAVVEDLDV